MTRIENDKKQTCEREVIHDAKNHLPTSLSFGDWIRRIEGNNGRHKSMTPYGCGRIQHTSVGTVATLVSIRYTFACDLTIEVNTDSRFCIGCFEDIRATLLLQDAPMQMMPGTIYTNAGIDDNAVIRVARGTEVTGFFMILDPNYYTQYLALRHPGVTIDPVRMLSRLQECHYYPELETVFDQLLRYDGTAGKEIFYDSKFNEIISWLIYYGNQMETSTADHVSREDRAAIRKAAAYLTDHIKDDPSLERLSRIAIMSPSKFKKTFKHVVGCTLTEYKQQRRLRLARKLLAETDHSLSEIASAVGYKKLENFNTFFAKYAHTSPKEFRKAAQRSRDSL